jgi:hypothetical protein
MLLIVIGPEHFDWGHLYKESTIFVTVLGVMVKMFLSLLM